MPGENTTRELDKMLKKDKKTYETPEIIELIFEEMDIVHGEDSVQPAISEDEEESL